MLTTGYWFVPSVMTLAAAALAFTLLLIDRNLLGARIGWLYAGGSDGAKTLLSMVAGSVITVAGVAFSITIAALSQASSQFGSRLLRNFLRDTGNHVVLGTFVATFVYCLLVLRTIHGKVQDGVEFVPQASVTAAVLMAIASIAVLIYFIHHVSSSLRAPTVVATVLAELDQVVARMADDQQGAAVALPWAQDPPRLEPPDGAVARNVPAQSGGYLQAVDYGGLTAIASRAELVFRLAYRPGDYVIEGSPLLQAWPTPKVNGNGGGGDPRLAQRVNAAFICGPHATTEQDVEQAVRQIVEVAVRALSPGINDPFTAINCIDALGSALCRLARTGLPAPLRYDCHNTLRLITPVTDFDGLADTALNQIRQCAGPAVAVTLRLLEMLAKCGPQMTSTPQRRALLRHAEMIYRQGERTITEPLDRADLSGRWRTAEEALGAKPQPDPGA